jgi:putative Mg2+ transporter-C (MgtC) family protein
MIFTYLSAHVDSNSISRIAAQILTGIGFRGAGLILKSEGNQRVRNLTTAASVWFSFFYRYGNRISFLIYGNSCNSFAVLVVRIPRISKLGINGSWK